MWGEDELPIVLAGTPFSRQDVSVGHDKMIADSFSLAENYLSELVFAGL
jgi:hypothetical protein